MCTTAGMAAVIRSGFVESVPILRGARPACACRCSILCLVRQSGTCNFLFIESYATYVTYNLMAGQQAHPRLETDSQPAVVSSERAREN